MDKYITAFPDFQFFVVFFNQGKLNIFLNDFKNIFLIYKLIALIQR